MSLTARAPDGEARPETSRLSRTPCGSLWLQIGPARCALTCAGALWLPDARALVVGDLHLEKGSAYAARGSLLPPYDTQATLERLEAEVTRREPRLLVLLGDSFHDPRALERLNAHGEARLQALGRGRTLLWVEGNHDTRDGATALGSLPGDVVDAVALAGLTLRHEPQPGRVAGEVAGHLHPVARIAAHGRAVRRRCFLTDGSRLILPAFGTYAGGLNARDVAFQGLFEKPPIAAVLGPEKVRAILFAALIGD